MAVYREGERVKIRYAGREIVGKVEISSRDGHAMRLEFNGLLGAYRNGMLVLREGGQLVDLQKRQPVEVERI